MTPFQNDPYTINIVEALRLAESIKATYVRKVSADEYRNFVDRFEIYLKRKKIESMKITEFTKRHAVRYLDDILLTRKVNALTRNNYMRVMRALFYVLIERGYIDNNPFANIKRLKESQKRRRTFDDKEKRIIIQCIKHDNKQLLLAVCLCYYCGMRPSEMRRLKIRDIDLKIGLILMDGSQTKNKDLGTITIPKVLLPLLNTYQFHTFPKGWYVFGPRTLKPGDQQCGRDTISRKHRKIVRDLHQCKFLSDVEGKTFYSWKDTAAKDLIELGLNVMDLKAHFRHKELTTTQRYMQTYGGVNNNIRDVAHKIF